MGFTINFWAQVYLLNWHHFAQAHGAHTNQITLNQQISFINILPYSDKRKQLLKMTFLVNEQNVSVMYIHINAISSYMYLDLHIFQQDECFCSKLKMEVEYAKSNVNE